MKKVKQEDLQKLEEISAGLALIVKSSKGKPNRIIEDMKWLVQKLREAFVIIEDLAELRR